MIKIEDILFETRLEAEKVASEIEELYDMWGYVTKTDVYELIGFNSFYADNMYGWRTKSPNCRVMRVRDGYALKMSEPEFLHDNKYNRTSSCRVSYRSYANEKRKPKNEPKPVEIVVALDQIDKTSLAMELAEEISKALTDRPVTIRIV